MSDTVDLVAIEPATPAAARLVLFDFDGVLIHGDAFALFIRQRFARSLVRKGLLLASLPFLLMSLPFTWRLPIRLALLGVGQQRYARLAQTAAAELVRRPRLFCRDALLALRRHVAQGDRVIVVTGCEHLLVQAILRELGLPDIEILASQLAPGWLGMKVRHHNVGKRKVERLAGVGLNACAVAYTDSLRDVPMLKLANEAVLVNGQPKLCKKMEKALGGVVTRVAWY